VGYDHHSYKPGSLLVGTGAEIIGIEYLEDVLNQMPKNISKRFLRDAIDEAGQPFMMKAKSNLRSADLSKSKKVNWDDLLETWTMKKTFRAGKNFGIKAQYDKSTEGEIFSKYGGQGHRSKSMWAIRGPHWMEHGTTGVGRKGKYKGIKYSPIAPTGWFRRAVDLSIDDCEMSFKRILARRMMTFLNKPTRGAGKFFRGYDW